MFINAAANHIHFTTTPTTTKDNTLSHNIFLNSQKGQKQTHSLSSLKVSFQLIFFFFLSHFSIIILQKAKNQS
jgi:hypothetical protein